ncbi:biotin/lipoyl-containing protein [Micromonospora sp. CCTCC AA 2012012]
MCRHLGGLLAAGGAPASRVTMAAGPVRLEVEWAVPAVRPAAALAPVAGDVPETPETPGAAVVAPLVGTFYRAPQPGAAPFVAVGDLVEPGQQVGIVEAMKLMNPVLAERAGRVARIVAGDGTSVEYEQPLVLLEPAGEGT